MCKGLVRHGRRQKQVMAQAGGRGALRTPAPIPTRTFVPILEQIVRFILWSAVACTLQSAGLTVPAVAQGEVCAGAPPSSVEVNALLAPVEFDLEKTISELTRLSSGAADSTDNHGGVALSFYEAKTGVRSSVKAGGRNISTGGVCVVVRAINVHFGLTERKILLAREILDNTCVREFVTTREQRRVTVDDAVLRLYVVQLKETLSLELSGGLTIKATTSGEAMELLKRILDARLQQAVEEFFARREKAQLAMHDKDEESALEQACGPGVRSKFERSK
jgi:hypothetical protein